MDLKQASLCAEPLDYAVKPLERPSSAQHGDCRSKRMELGLALVSAVAEEAFRSHIHFVALIDPLPT